MRKKVDIHGCGERRYEVVVVTEEDVEDRERWRRTIRGFQKKFGKAKRGRFTVNSEYADVQT